MHAKRVNVLKIGPERARYCTILAMFFENSIQCRLAEIFRRPTMFKWKKLSCTAASREKSSIDTSNRIKINSTCVFFECRYTSQAQLENTLRGGKTFEISRIDWMVTYYNISFIHYMRSVDIIIISSSQTFVERGRLRKIHSIIVRFSGGTPTRPRFFSRRHCVIYYNYYNHDTCSATASKSVSRCVYKHRSYVCTKNVIWCKCAGQK